MLKNPKHADAQLQPNLSDLIIKQPNRVTYADFSRFSLIQSKIFVLIMKALQNAIKAHIEGRDWQQIDMFIPNVDGLIRVPIVLSEIGKANQYPEYVAAVKDMQNVAFKYKNKINDKEYLSHSNLIAVFNEPILTKGKAIFYLDLTRTVAKRLVEIDIANNNKPFGFTSYLHHVAMAAKSKYTIKLYMIIASWKVNGSLTITYNNLREQLGIANDVNENEDYIFYPFFSGFYRDVLLKVQKDLENKADCWFDCKEKGFVSRKGKKVIALNFKILTQEFIEATNSKFDNIKNLLKVHASFKQEHLDQMKPLFTQANINKDLFQDVVRLIQYVNDLNNKIKYKQQYIIKSLVVKYSK